MDMAGSDHNNDRTILIQTDAETLNLTSFLEAVLQACSTNDSQDPVSIIIQVNQTECQAETDNCPLDPESIIDERTDGVCSFSNEIISVNSPQEENRSGVTADCNVILLTDYDLNCQEDSIGHNVGTTPEKKGVVDKDANNDQNANCPNESVHPEQFQIAQTVIQVNSTEANSSDDFCSKERQHDVTSRCLPLNVMKSKSFPSGENGKDKGSVDEATVVLTGKEMVLSNSETDSKCLLRTVRNPDSSTEHSSSHHSKTLRSNSRRCKIIESDFQSSVSRGSGSIKCSIIKGQTCIITGTPTSDSYGRKHYNDRGNDLTQNTGNKPRNTRRKSMSQNQCLSNQDNCHVKTRQVESSELSEIGDSEQAALKSNGLDFVKENLEKADVNIGLNGRDKDRKNEESLQKYYCEKGGKFTCETCGKDFDRKFNLERHLKSKSVHKQPVKKKYVPKPAKCDICDKMFHSTSAMCLHRKKHDETQRYSCPHCEHKFTQKGNLNFHIKTIHDGIKELVCDRCGKQFSNAAGLMYHNQRIHLEEEMKKRYLQLDCIKNIQHKDNTAREANHQVKVLGQVSYACPVCSQTFTKIFSWFAHLNLHTLSSNSDAGVRQQVNAVIAELQGTDNIFSDIVLFPCTVCDYVAFSKSDIIIHLNRHSEDKPYCCEHCDQTFASASECSTHEQYHTKKFRHLCKICKSGFPLLGQLKLHLLKEHQVSGDDLPGSKGYSCDICGKQFIYKTLLKKHVMSTHKGLKNYTCQSCGKAFKTKYAAEVHLRTHTRDCHYSCQACGRSFIDPSNLIHHVKRLHKTLSPSVKQLHRENQLRLKSNLQTVNKSD